MNDTERQAFIDRHAERLAAKMAVHQVDIAEEVVRFRRRATIPSLNSRVQHAMVLLLEEAKGLPRSGLAEFVVALHREARTKQHPGVRRSMLHYAIDTRFRLDHISRIVSGDHNTELLDLSLAASSSDEREADHTKVYAALYRMMHQRLEELIEELDTVPSHLSL